MVEGGMIDPKNPRMDTPAWKTHQKHPFGDAQNLARLQDWFDAPEHFDDLHYLLQVSQARGLQTAVEWYRALWPRCTGTLYWQLNDCWPVTSWAAVDSAGRKKPLWYATRRFFAPSLATIQPGGAGYKSGDPLTLHLINDIAPAHAGLNRAVVTRRSFDGRVLGSSTLDIQPAGAGVTSIALSEDIFKPSDASTEFICVDSPHRAIWFFEADKHLKYPQPKFTVSLEGARLTVQAQSLIRDLCIFIDRLDPAATISDQLITLLPGESFTFEHTSPQRFDVQQLTRSPVMQCANRYGSK